MGGKRNMFQIKKETIEQLNNVINAVGTQDSTLVFSLGQKDMGEKLVCSAMLLAGSEQVLYRFMLDKPKDFTEGTQFAVKSAKFSSIVSGLLAFKEDILLKMEKGRIVLKTKKAQVPCEILSEIPAKIDVDAPLISLRVGEIWGTFVRKGLLASDSVANAKGTQNSMLVVNTVTGELMGMSMDGFCMARSKMRATLNKAAEGNAVELKAEEDMKANLQKVIEESEGKQTADGFIVPIPHEAILHIKALTEGQNMVRILIDKKHISFTIGNSMVYTATQGAVAPMPVSFAASVDQEGVAIASFDAGAFISGIDFANKMNTLSGETKRIPLHLNLKKDMLVISTGKGDEVITKIAYSGKSGEDAMAAVNGGLLRTAAGFLDKGNLLVRFLQNAVILANGNLTDGADASGAVLVMQVMEKSEEATKETEEADTATETE